jgi:hypothetical protein
MEIFLPKTIALAAACLTIDDRLVVFPEPVNPMALDPVMLRALPGRIRWSVGEAGVLRRVKHAAPGDTVIVVPDLDTADIWALAICRADDRPMPEWLRKFAAAGDGWRDVV